MGVGLVVVKKGFLKFHDLSYHSRSKNIHVNNLKKIPKELVLPHPRIQDRAFVLSPLLDIEPNWTHPVLKKTVSQLYDELSEQEKKNIQIVE